MTKNNNNLYPKDWTNKKIKSVSFDEPSNDYPLGGTLEPYDIEREKDLIKD